MNNKAHAKKEYLYPSFPDLLNEWDWKQNVIDPKSISKHSNKKAFWICQKGHSYLARIDSRTNGSGCPYCSNRKVLKGFNDLCTTNPTISKEWHPTKNGNLLPDNITCGSGRIVWWKCNNCGYEWKSPVYDRNNGKGCPCCKNKVVVKGKNDLLTTHPQIIKDWDFDRNTISPDKVTFGSNKSVFWKCCHCGYEWKAKINDRTKKNGTECPKCSKRSGTSFPEQAIFYYLNQLGLKVFNRIKISEYEIDVFIKDLSLGIEYDGHYYHPEVNKRKDCVLSKENIRIIHIWDGAGNLDNTNECLLKNNVIYCKYDKHYNYLHNVINLLIEFINKEFFLNYKINIDIERDNNVIKSNYLAYLKSSIDITNPELVLDWDYKKNHNLKPYMFSKGSEEMIWWKCHKCGYEWQTAIFHRCSGTGCPCCKNKVVVRGKNDLLSQYPELSKGWHYSLNYPNRPEQYVYGSGEMVWWKCKKCGYEWKKRIVDRVNGKGCACCSGRKIIKGVNDLFSTNPELQKDWDYNKNVNINPSSISKGSHKKPFWKCHKCGHEWQAFVFNRTRGKGCPKCKKER